MTYPYSLSEATLRTMQQHDAMDNATFKQMLLNRLNKQPPTSVPPDPQEIYSRWESEKKNQQQTTPTPTVTTYQPSAMLKTPVVVSTPEPLKQLNMADNRAFILGNVEKQFPKESPAFKSFLTTVFEYLVRAQTTIGVQPSSYVNVVNSTAKLPMAVDNTGQMPPIPTRELWYEFSRSVPKLCTSDIASIWSYFEHGATLFDLWAKLGKHYADAGGGNMLMSASFNAIKDALFFSAVIAAEDLRPFGDSYYQHANNPPLDYDGSETDDDAQSINQVCDYLRTMLYPSDCQFTAEYQRQSFGCVRTIVRCLTLNVPDRVKLEWSLARQESAPRTFVLRAEGMESIPINLVHALRQRFAVGAHQQTWIRNVGLGLSVQHQVLSDIAPTGATPTADKPLDAGAIKPVRTTSLVVDFQLELPAATEFIPATSTAAPKVNNDNVPIPPFRADSPILSLQNTAASLLSKVLGKRKAVAPAPQQEDDGDEEDDVAANGEQQPKRIKLF